MKKIYMAVCCLFVALHSLAQQPVEITGLLKKENKTAVKLYKVEEGKLVELSSTNPASNSKFGFMFYPDYEGFYVLSTTAANALDGYKFYFKGGEKLSLTLLDTTYVLTGNTNSKANVLLTQWYKLLQPVVRKTVNIRSMSTFVDFFPELDKVLPQAKAFLKDKVTDNPVFNKRLKQIVAQDLDLYALYFLYTPRMAHPSTEEWHPFYSSIKAEELSKNAAQIYGYPWGSRLINMALSANMTLKGFRFNTPDAVDKQLAMLTNDTLKGDFVLEQATRIKDFGQFKTLQDKYGHYLLTKSQQAQQFEILAKVVPLKPGDEAFKFTYPDKTGKNVSLDDLKGKVVLVDVWATWCGPCKEQIPFLKKLEEEMKGKDLAIVSISVDAEKDRQKWLQMIVDEQLGGTQLFASAKNDLMKYYRISGIPRFMVFDKQGKIVTIDAPRPSDPQLKALLEKAMAK
ncbi:TlpA disulfide reductase family protein [Pedobacter sp. KR3-3]|uniref:TlpA disulfide reductase family protein n=1 Tax=Pedobacter albus TaxID=3113905 RepID=A0ABU7I420_9SPHI|nr:TlpA disulfide reductase family protein [Pedobacter sp. KR3-3]MEE1944204.1 TlpA disulfide reductase family protein [Pedobacter sp. KR3-3]